MLIKTFDVGTGAGYGPVEYLISSNPFGRGKRDTPPRVLRGEPTLLRQQIDAVPYKWKYLSGVCSFALEDTPTPEQMDELMDEFEELAFAGLPMASRSILWVYHEEKGRPELHFLTPRQEVHSGKSFNPFPPNARYKFDKLREKFNYTYGWARPDDERRARPVRLGHEHLVKADAKRKGKEFPTSVKENVAASIEQKVYAGIITSRKDIIDFLRAEGYSLPRIGKDYLTILDKEGKRHRLKGTLFHEDFSAATWMTQQGERPHIVDTIDIEKAHKADMALQKAIERTATYNRGRYQISEVQDTNFINNLLKQQEKENARITRTRESARNGIKQESSSQYHSRIHESESTSCGRYQSFNAARGNSRGANNATSGRSTGISKLYYQSGRNHDFFAPTNDRLQNRNRQRITTCFRQSTGHTKWEYSTFRRHDATSLGRIGNLQTGYRETQEGRLWAKLASQKKNVWLTRWDELVQAPLFTSREKSLSSAIYKQVQLLMGNVTLQIVGAQLQQIALAKAKEEERRIQTEAQQNSQSWLSQWNQMTQTPLFALQGNNLSSAIHEQAQLLVGNITLQTVGPQLQQTALTKAKKKEKCIQIEARQNSQSWLSQWSQVTQSPLFTSRENSLSFAIHEQSQLFMGNVTLQSVGAQLQQMALAKDKEDERRIQIEAQQSSQSWLSQWSQATQAPLFTSQENNLSSAIHEQATRLVNNATLQAIAIHLHEKHHDPKNEKSILQHLHNEFVTCPHEPERFKKSLHLCVKVLSSVLLPENKLDDTAYRTNFAYEEDSEEQSIFTSME